MQLSKPMCLLPWRKILSLSSNAGYCTNILKKLVQTTQLNIHLSEMKDTHGELSPNNTWTSFLYHFTTGEFSHMGIYHLSAILIMIWLTGWNQIGLKSLMQHLTKATIKDPNSKMTTGTTDFSLVSLIPSWVNPTNHQCLVRKPDGILPKCLYWPFCTSAGPRYEFRYSSLYLKLPRPHLGQQVGQFSQQSLRLMAFMRLNTWRTLMTNPKVQCTVFWGNKSRCLVFRTRNTSPMTYKVLLERKCYSPLLGTPRWDYFQPQSFHGVEMPPSC